MVILNPMKSFLKKSKILLIKFEIIFRFKSIKNKIFYFSFLVSLSIILLVIFTAYFFSYTTIKKTSISREKNSLELISNQTDIILNSAEVLSTNLIVHSDVQQILKNHSVNNIYPDKNEILTLKRQLDNIIYKNTSISGAIIHSTNGLTLKTDNNLISMIDSDIPLLTSSIWHGAIFDKYKKSYFYLSRNILDMNTGKLIGYLELFIPESFLSKNYTSNNSNSKYINFFLINDSGFIISSSNSNDLTNNIYKTRDNINLATSLRPFEIIEDNTENKLTIMLYYKKLNCNIVADLYLKDIINEKQNLIFYLIFLSIVGLILSYTLSKIISKSITKPIYNLYNAIDEIENGNWSTEIEIISLDEIGILSKKLNHLIVYIKNLIDNIKYEQTKKKEFELELIQLQIKPHFLYNSLENISALAELERNDDVVDMISNLSTFYRGVLNKGNNITTIKEELDLTESYLKIMKIRYCDIFDYYIDCDISLNDYSCLKLLIQPLVENSIYHGLKNCEYKGTIQLSIAKLSTNLKFIIKDTGIGMTENELIKVIEGNISSSSKGGFAVKNTIERLNLFYPNDCNFTIESKKNIGTTITIIIPAMRKEIYYDKYTFS